jgi:hypothetical protein
MPRKSIRLPLLTSDLVASYVHKFDSSQATVEQALTKLFALFPANDNPTEVLIKVVALNDLYRTGILATAQVADHIFRLDIDAAIKDGKPEAVHRIARVQLDKGTRNNYSFATKYCAWHNSDSYPIYDGFVSQMLWEYRKQDHFDKFDRQDLGQYERFKNVLLRFRSHYQLESFSVKDIDKFLWLAGKEHSPAPWQKSVAKNK